MVMSIVIPASMTAILYFDGDSSKGFAKNGLIYYQCIGEYHELYDFATGKKKNMRFIDCDAGALVCKSVKIVYLLITSNGFEMIFLGLACRKIIKQRNQVADMLSGATVRNRRR